MSKQSNSFCKKLGFALFFLGISAMASYAIEPSTDTCVTCHQNPDFMVTNKKLYDYFQTWRASIHGQEDVTCVDCHGGNPKAEKKNDAHGDAMSASNSGSMVNFKNIPVTCGECHNDLLAAYRTSRHFSELIEKDQVKTGPNCVTCHGSLNSKKLTVNSVRDVCQNCHNEKTKNHPGIPVKAEMLLNDFNAIRGYERFIQKRADPEMAIEIRKIFNPKKVELAELWHSFDLEKIEKATANLLEFAKEKRELIKKNKENK